MGVFACSMYVKPGEESCKEYLHTCMKTYGFFFVVVVCLIRSFGTLNAEPYELSEIGD